MAYQILNYREIRNFIHQAKVDVCGLESWDYSVQDFSQSIQSKIQAQAQKLCDEYNLIVRKSNELLNDCTILETQVIEKVEDCIYAALKAHEDNGAVFNEVTKCFTNEGIVVILNTAKEIYKEKIQSKSN